MTVHVVADSLSSAVLMEGKGGGGGGIHLVITLVVPVTN